MNRSDLVALAVAASLGACGGSPSQPQAAPEASTQQPPSEPSPPVVDEVFGPWPTPTSAPARPAATPPTVDLAFARDVVRDGRAGIVWIESAPFVVGQEYPVEDVRDTKRAYHDDVGAMVEEPIDGTINPAKSKLNAERAARAEALAERHARLAQEQLRHFRELFGESPASPGVAARPIRLLAVWSDAAWDRWGGGSDESRTGFVNRFVDRFVPADDLVVWRFGPTAMSRQDEIRCAEGRVQKQADVDLGNGLARLLLHRAAARLRGVDPQADLAEGPCWLQQGLQEFMSAVEIDEAGIESLADVTWFHERVLLERVAQGRGYDVSPKATASARELSRHWTIGELLRRTTSVDCLERGERMAPGQGPWMTELFCARAWGFFHFLWFYDGGKYRSKLRDCLRSALAGTLSSSMLAEIMVLPGGDDWDEIEREFDWYWDRLLARKIGRSHVTRIWETPATTAPNGRVEDDVEFCEVWGASHADRGKK